MIPRFAPTLALYIGVSVSAGAFTTLLAGCDRPSSAAMNTSPDHATPHTLVARFNEIATATPNINPVAVNALVRSDNPLHRRYLALVEAMAPVQRFEQTMWDAFGEGLDAHCVAGPLSPVSEAARIIAVRDHTAIAGFIDAAGESRTLYLSQDDDGAWWIDGRTLDADTGNPLTHESISRLAKRHRYLSRVATTLRGRVISGDFKSAQAVREALRVSLQEAFPHTRDIEELISPNPGMVARPAPGANVRFERAPVGDSRRPTDS